MRVYIPRQRNTFGYNSTNDDDKFNGVTCSLGISHIEISKAKIVLS